MPAIDIVIPAHEKDFPVLRATVRAVLRHVSPVRRVHVVSATRFETRDARVRWVDERLPRDLPSLAELRTQWSAEHPATADRAPWVFQQLLKLGAGSYVADLTPSYLVVDSDVLFLRPVSFDPEVVGRFPYSFAFEYHPPYREAFARLVGEAPPTGASLTAHHMLYDSAMLAELQAELEQRHGMPWHTAYLRAVDRAESSSISEMDVYGWWVLARHPELAVLRQLHWRDVRVVPRALGRALWSVDYDFVAAHAWARQARLPRAAAIARRSVAELKAGRAG
jgi:hypothetical protein